jgi:heme-degrading monooxygenase HmoA
VIAVIFELIAQPGQRQTYLDLASGLASQLTEIDGFLSIERFQSMSDPDKLLSLSFWRDEAAVARWRSLEQHRAAQVQGRATIFLDYRLRVAAVARDYGMERRDQAPA